jgi:hypothetical protein
MVDRNRKAASVSTIRSFPEAEESSRAGRMRFRLQSTFVDRPKGGKT